MNILIVTGGTSSERKISLVSARTVKEALIKNGHRVLLFDFKKGYGELKKKLAQFDVVFPIMHGKEGEDGQLYQFLSSAKKPFVGSDARGARTAFNKILFKKYCNENNIRTADWNIIKNSNGISRFGFPCVLKAAYGGSSLEVALLNQIKDLFDSRVKKILRLPGPFYVEKLLKGVEITIGVMLEKALPVIEIVPPKDTWFNYKNKYSGESKEIPFAPSVKQSMQQHVQRLALKIHQDLNLGSFSRTDIILDKNIPYVLEVNTPGGIGLTPQSLFPKAAKAAGFSFEQMVEKMLEGRQI